ncbi:minor tail protein [Arthrobacter phage Sloopyjoe]|nr:minor tail protein [Arthrobacter phage StarLord]WAB09434.1 minor tail protein [Arthrobacter phage Sloopyjoe]
MVALSWGDAGKKFFETGIDRGVLYVGDTAVPWNGLTAVSENPSGGTANPYYMNGLQYLNRPTMEEYEASIESFSKPSELESCVGKRSIRGLTIDQQPKKSFGFSYRTKIGNDIDGIDHGYKIHLVYNAQAKAPKVQNETLTDSPDLVSYSWDISAVPQRVDGYLPTAHFVIDSTRTNPGLLALLEGYLYGSDGVEPRLITPDQLKAMFATWSTVGYSQSSNFLGIAPSAKSWIQNLATNPTLESVTGSTTTMRTNLCTNPSFETNLTSVGTPAWVTLTRSTFASAITSGGYTISIVVGPGATTDTYLYQDIDITSSLWVAWKASMRWSAKSRYFKQRIKWLNSGGSYTGTEVVGPITMAPNNTTGGERYLISGQAPADAVKARLMINLYETSAELAPLDQSVYQTDAWHSATGRTQADAEWRVGTYFDGSTPAAGDFTYAWSGTAHASTSYELGQILTLVTSAGGSNGVSSSFRSTADVPDGETYAARMVWSQGSTGGSNGINYNPQVSGVAGDVITAKVWVKLDVFRYVQLLIRPRNGSTQVVVDNTFQQAIQADTWTEMSATVTATGDYTNILIWPWFRSPSTANAGNYVIFGKPLITINGVEVPYFHGDSTDTVYRNQHVDPEWVGTPKASISQFSYYPALSETANEGDMMLVEQNVWAVDNGVWENLGPLADALE